MSLFKVAKIFFLSIAFLVSLSSFVFAVETSEVGQTPEPITNSVVESTNMDPTIQQRINNLESRVNDLDLRISNMQTQVNNANNRAGFGLVSFLFGAFCALWAQNTRRNAFGWFILGAIGTVFTVLGVLWNNHYDITHPPSESN